MALLQLFILIAFCSVFGTINGVSDAEKFDCYPEHGNQSLCEARGCVWEKSNTKGVPWCFYKESFQAGYEVTGDKVDTSLGERVNLIRMNYKSIYGKDSQTVTLDIEYQTSDRVRFKFYDPNVKRYEVPVEMPKPTTKAADRKYEIKYTRKKPFAMQIIRKDTKAVLWDSSVGLFVFSDQFLQISTKTPSTYVYGIGEQEHPSFRHNMTWMTWPIFTRDQFPFNGGNVYGHHPFYMSLEEDGKAHGVFLLNSNAMEMALQPLPAITYRTIGGVLDFYVFLGPTPEAVVSQYTESIGRPFMPPYWSLGFQLSRWGYNDIATVKKLVDNMRKYDIPQDVQYGDIDYMVRQLDFTYDKDKFAGLPDYVRSIKKEGLRYIIILDPAIGANETTPYRPYDYGNTLDVWVKDNKGNTQFGKVWPTYENTVVNSSLDWDEQTRLYRQWAAFPDYFHNNATTYWGTLIRDFHKEVEFDGLWIDMNEPANFVTGTIYGCPKTKWDYPPYKPTSVLGTVLADKTLCMSAQHATGLHYDLHSLYGWKQSIVTQQIVRDLLKKRSIVLSRSSFASSGKYAGHWLGDNVAKWNQMHASIIGMLEFNLFGMPYIGADICGFFDAPSEELCTRWMQLGAFYPFSRNHNGFGNKAQDPTAFGPNLAKASRKVLRMRYSLLPYLYTLFYESRRTGATVVRSLMSEFTSDKNTWDIDKEFLWGPALLVSPVLEKGGRSVRAYVPDDRWFQYDTGKERPGAGRKNFLTLEAPLDYIHVHVRGGHVVPTQEPARNTMLSRKNKMGIVVAMSDDYKAKGQMFWDDGESIDTFENGQYLLVNFTADKTSVKFSVVKNSYDGAKDIVWGSVYVYGLKTNKISWVKANGNDVTKNSTITEKTQALKINGLQLDITKDHVVTWDVSHISASVPVAAKPVLYLMLLLTIVIALTEH
ncbi:maltase-glucoamylase, intestinal-like [Actinia tenebrosa]|uniref:alpha-glucosidase n=1 Tax=Actinia tenebrosa TaxID=6105 RepID=A0A6P8HB32_ACTTE|nr:maltase-glucoamylase, intestinal-like [Actinia tenebrosa]